MGGHTILGVKETGEIQVSCKRDQWLSLQEMEAKIRRAEAEAAPEGDESGPPAHWGAPADDSEDDHEAQPEDHKEDDEEAQKMRRAESARRAEEERKAEEVRKVEEALEAADSEAHEDGEISPGGSYRSTTGLNIRGRLGLR